MNIKDLFRSLYKNTGKLNYAHKEQQDFFEKYDLSVIEKKSPSIIVNRDMKINLFDKDR